LPLPAFHVSLVDDEQNECDIDESTHTSDEDGKKSFDFTGELKKLNESGASDRRTFTEGLENAFRTPAKVDLRYDFGGHVLVAEISPPVPKFPVNLGTTTSNSDGDGSESLDVGS
jgi:serine/arginine repetitive matrix protein 2